MSSGRKCGRYEVEEFRKMAWVGDGVERYGMEKGAEWYGMGEGGKWHGK